MISAISKYMPRWLMAIIATALVLATVVGSNQDTAEAIDPADTDTVYIADGTNFADALMGATIASLNTSPMLGVAGTNSGDVIPGDTAEELDRLTNDKASPLDTIFIFGGTSAVSADVENQLGQWANDVQRIEGDSRWGTYEAISQMLPSAVDEAVHAQEADHATEADNADTLDGNDSTDFLGTSEQAADSDKLDGRDTTALAPRFWSSSDDDSPTKSVAAADQPAELQSVTIDAPTDGSLVITGTVFVDNSEASDAFPRIIPKLDGSTFVTGDWVAVEHQSASGTAGDRDTISFTVTVDVTAGTHTVSYDINSAGPSDFRYNKEMLTVQFYPSDFSTVN